MAMPIHMEGRKNKVGTVKEIVVPCLRGMNPLPRTLSAWCVPIEVPFGATPRAWACPFPSLFGSFLPKPRDVHGPRYGSMAPCYGREDPAPPPRRHHVQVPRAWSQHQDVQGPELVPRDVVPTDWEVTGQIFNRNWTNI